MIDRDDYTLALDAGLNASGWALFNRRILERCGLLRSSERTPLLRAEETSIALNRLLPYGETVELVVEVPQVYVQRKQKGDPNDLIDLALFIGVITKSVPHYAAHTVLPRQWKGTIRKTRHLQEYIVHKRLMESLPDAEVERYADGLRRAPPHLRHNVADAVGIGSWWINNEK